MNRVKWLAPLVALLLLAAASPPLRPRITFADNGCLVAAVQMEAEVTSRAGLNSHGVWTRLVRVTYVGTPTGHAYCVFSLRNGKLWAYDAKKGSVQLATEKRDLSSVIKALQLQDHTITGGVFLD